MIGSHSTDRNGYICSRGRERINLLPALGVAVTAGFPILNALPAFRVGNHHTHLAKTPRRLDRSRQTGFPSANPELHFISRKSVSLNLRPGEAIRFLKWRIANR